MGKGSGRERTLVQLRRGAPPDPEAWSGGVRTALAAGLERAAGVAGPRGGLPPRRLPRTDCAAWFEFPAALLGRSQAAGQEVAGCAPGAAPGSEMRRWLTTRNSALRLLLRANNLQTVPRSPHRGALPPPMQTRSQRSLSGWSGNSGVQTAWGEAAAVLAHAPEHMRAQAKGCAPRNSAVVFCFLKLQLTAFINVVFQTEAVHAFRRLLAQHFFYVTATQPDLQWCKTAFKST